MKTAAGVQAAGNGLLAAATPAAVACLALSEKAVTHPLKTGS
jgi:hypothetical protein